MRGPVERDAGAAVFAAADNGVSLHDLGFFLLVP
ncbi:MAG: hypothetical protein ACJAXR_002587 [Halopseudomonas sp.]|jgi:hypothetical protein